MHRGYTKRWRKRWDKDYCKDHLLWVIMSYFIDHANYRESTVYVPNIGAVTLKRGQHIFSTLKLAAKLGVDRQRIRTKLKILKKMNFLTIKTTNKFSIAYVINYDTYQDKECSANQQTDQQLTSTQPAPNQQLTTPNKDKKVKKVKKENNILFLPEWLDLEIWEEFKKYRQNGKGKFTPYAQKLAISKLEKLRTEGDDPNEIMKKSIENGWTGLYPLKENKMRGETAEQWIKRVSQD